MEEHNQDGANGLDEFIDELIGDKATELTPDERAEMKKSIAIEIDDALNRAVLSHLSDDALQEIENHIDDDPTALSELILKKAAEAQLDLNALTTDTLLQFRALYKGEILADDIDKLGDPVEEAPSSLTSDETPTEASLDTQAESAEADE